MYRSYENTMPNKMRAVRSLHLAQPNASVAPQSTREKMVSDVYLIPDLGKVLCPSENLASLHEILRAPSEEFWQHVRGCVRCARAVVAIRPKFGAGSSVGAAARARGGYEHQETISRNQTYLVSRARSGEGGAIKDHGTSVVIKEVLSWARQRNRKNHLLARACLRREAEIVSRLEHRAIVSVLDRGERKRTGEPFYVMKHVRGETLDSIVRSQRGGLFGKLLGFLDATDAIAHAHQRGVMHRNISPSNVMITGGTAVVLGWSAARYEHPEAWEDAIFDAAELAGVGPEWASASAAGFAAPELASPQHDRRVDLFSLGATLKFIVSEGAWPGGAKLPNPLALCSEWLNSIVAKAMAPNPCDRYSSVAEFALALREALSRQWVVPTAGRDLRVSGESATDSASGRLSMSVRRKETYPPPLRSPGGRLS